MYLLKIIGPILIFAAIFGAISVAAVAHYGRKKGLPFFEAWRTLKAEIESDRRAHKRGPGQQRFKKRDRLLSRAEAEFHGALCAALPDYAIFAKVRVADVVQAHERFSGDFLRISQKHFDWVICHPTNFEPVAAIELDDSSHKTFSARQRDQVKNSATLDAGIPLVRFRCSVNYEINQVSAEIRRAIAPGAGRTHPE